MRRLPEMAPLVFRRGGLEKWYAATPCGEIAYGEGQGLYEWRNGALIFWSGGDRQGSSKGAMWTLSSGPIQMTGRLLGLKLSALQAMHGGGRNNSTARDAGHG